MNNNYNLIAKNIIDNFLDPSFKWTSISIKGMVIYSIKKLSWFPVEYDVDNDFLIFMLNDEINIKIKIIWETKNNRFIIKSFLPYE